MDRIGPYGVVRELARGGMGVVYHALAPQGQPVAVKVLHSVTAAQQARLLREGQALLRLHHPNVVRVHDVGQDRGRPYLVMDLIDGETLQRRLDRQGPLRPRVAADMARRLALALAHAHERGVVHRDLKPGNVILQAITGDPLLTDFGLARPLEQGATRLTQSGVMLGTLGFAAPEQLMGDPERVGPAADIWGLGATLYAALSGSAPFDGDSALEIVVATQERAPRRPSDHQQGLPRALEEICLRCLEKDPADRFASATELAQALAEWLADERVAPASGAPRAAIAVGAVCLVVGVSLGFALRTSPQPEDEKPVATTAATSPAPTPAPDLPPPGPPPTPVDEDAEVARVALARANARLDDGDFPGALPFLDEAVKRAPGNPEAWALRSAVRVRLKDADGALADAERALVLDPTHVAALLNRGAARGVRGDFEQAVGDLERVVALAPDEDLGWRDLTRAYVDTGQLDRALAAAERAVKLVPESGPALATRGWCRMRRGEFAEARADLDRALLLDPDDPDSWASRGMVRAQQGDMTGAIGDWVRATALDPSDVDSWTNCAAARLATQDYAGAASDCTHALELAPDSFSALSNRGLARKNLGELEGADADLTRAIELQPQQANTYYHRGLVRLRAGNIEGARADAARAVALLEREVGPNHPMTLRAIQLRDDPQNLPR